MKAVIGLGNPGTDYAQTRHNAGFFILDELAQRHGATVPVKRFQSRLRDSRIDGQKVLLVAPQTYMNLSGHAAREVARWHHLELTDLLIVVDDFNLPFGTLRFRGRGTAGGHNGLTSVLEQLGTTEVPRLRVGIGRGDNAARAHVLSRFTPEERLALPGLIAEAADGVELWVRAGAIAAMNTINRPPNVPEDAEPDEPGQMPVEAPL